MCEKFVKVIGRRPTKFLVIMVKNKATIKAKFSGIFAKISLNSVETKFVSDLIVKVARLSVIQYLIGYALIRVSKIIQLTESFIDVAGSKILNILVIIVNCF